MTGRLFRTRGDGRWFPAGAAELADSVGAFIDGAPAADPPVSGGVVAAIAPHAGYVYAGGVAGSTFRALRDAARRGRVPAVVVILGASHRMAFDGVAWLDADAVRSPLGDAEVDRACLDELMETVPSLDDGTRLHAGEHSAENLIPFLQVALPAIPIVVGLTGGQSPDTRRALVRSLAGMREARSLCVLASTDLLHDADYDHVVATDRATLAMMERLDSEGLNRAWSYERQVCCGIGPVLVAMEFARAAGCDRGRCLAYENSGDIDPTGRGNWVVGYGSVVFGEP